jgi:hypothetical protein
MTPNIPLALVLAAAAAAALRAAARRPQAPGTAPAPVTATASPSQSQPQPAAPAGPHDGTGGDTARPPAPSGRPASTLNQAQHIFHELHADARHPHCAVCDSQYGAA